MIVQGWFKKVSLDCTMTYRLKLPDLYLEQTAKVSKQHVERYRKYLKLKQTKADLQAHADAGTVPKFLITKPATCSTSCGLSQTTVEEINKELALIAMRNSKACLQILIDAYSKDIADEGTFFSGFWITKKVVPLMKEIAEKNFPSTMNMPAVIEALDTYYLEQSFDISYQCVFLEDKMADACQDKKVDSIQTLEGKFDALNINAPYHDQEASSSVNQNIVSVHPKQQNTVSVRSTPTKPLSGEHPHRRTISRRALKKLERKIADFDFYLSDNVEWNKINVWVLAYYESPEFIQQEADRIRAHKSRQP